MKRFYLKWSLALAGAFATVLPVSAKTADSELARRFGDNQPRQVDPVKLKKIMNYQKLMARFGHVYGEGLGPAPSSETEVTIQASRPKAVNVASTRSIEEPRGTLHIVVPSWNGATAGYADAFYGTVDLSTGKVNRVYKGSHYSNGDEYDSQGGTIADGILYIPQFLQDMVTAEITIIWKRINIETGERLPNINFGSVENAYCYGLTYNPETKKFYGLSMDLVKGVLGEFVEIDINGPTPTVLNLGNVGASGFDFMAALTYCPRDGEVYGLNSSGTLYLLDQITGQRTVAAEFDTMDAPYVVPDADTPTSFTFSPLDSAFVTIYRDAINHVMQIGFIDFESMEPAPGASLDMICYTASIDCVDAYAEDEAPFSVDLTSFNIKDAELTGSYSFTAPEIYYNGLALPATKTINIAVTMNGKTLESLTMKPGEIFNGNFTVEQGQCRLEIIPEFDGKTGPAIARSFWAGHDNPEQPSGLSYLSDVITWKAPGGIGQHGGYVDTSVLTYDVYVDGVKNNTTPITGTTYTIPVPSSQARRVLTVTATANGMTSAHSAGIECVNGPALTLPQAYQPTEAQSKLFQTANVDNDAYYFRYFANPTPAHMGIMMTEYHEMPNDWLFMPLMHFPSKDYLYNVAFTYSNYYQTSDKHMSDIHVWIGTKPTPDGMVKEIYSRGAANVKEAIDINANFMIDEPGDYYIGFYTGPVVSGQSRGVKLYNFNVSELKEKPVTVPASATDVVVKGADKGELAVDVTMTLPTTDLLGNPLDATKKLTATGRIVGELDEIYTNKAVGLPGETVHFTVEADVVDGFTFIYLNVANEDGEGIERIYRTFVGYDTPSTPQNVKGVPTADNMGVILTWEPPTGGVNGGYVDPEKLEYIITEQSSTASYAERGRTTDLTYTYYPASPKQSAIFIGPAAYNTVTKTQSTLNTFYYDYIGTPYEMPLDETFRTVGAAGFTYSPWKYNADGRCKNFPWSHVTSMSGFGIGDPIIHEGAFCCMSLEGGAGYGELIAPKVSTKNIDEPFFGINFWDYPYAASFEVYGRRSGHEELEKLFDITPERGEPRWNEWSQKLPAEYGNCEWVQFRLRANIGSSNISYGLIDEYKVFMDVAHDFKPTSITGPGMVWGGDIATYITTVVNTGMETGGTTFKVELLAGDKVLARQDYTASRMTSNQSYIATTSFEIKPEYVEYDGLTVRATILDETDEVAHNNVREVPVAISETVLPIVREISAKWADDSRADAVLTWETPTMTYGGYDNIEQNEPFKITDRIGYWKNVDHDGLPPFYMDYRFDDDQYPCGWVVLNHDVLGTASEERLSAHSGKQALLARSIGYDMNTEEPKQSSEWLISPEVVGGTEVGFWFNCLSTAYTETIEVWYSTTGTELAETVTRDPIKGNYSCGDFKRAAVFSKSGDETWEYVHTMLPEDAKYMAIVYCSYGQFGALIDDIEFTPKNLLTWDIAGYDVWRYLNNDKTTYTCVAEKVQGNSYTDKGVNDQNARYFLATKVNLDGKVYTGPRSTEAVLYNSGINEIDNLDGIYTGKGYILAEGLDGTVLSIYGSDGKHIRQATVAGDSFQIPAEAGIYVVKAGNKVAKVVVK